MLYWDSSALVASLILEIDTDRVRACSESAGEMRAYTSILTPLEVESAVQRRLKEQSITLEQAKGARLLAAEFRRRTTLVTTDQNLLDTALHLQKVYSLRPLDAVQLASARVGTEDPSSVNFLCLDSRLNEAARQEGFSVLL